MKYWYTDKTSNNKTANDKTANDKMSKDKTANDKMSNATKCLMHKMSNFSNIKLNFVDLDIFDIN